MKHKPTPKNLRLHRLNCPKTEWSVVDSVAGEEEVIVQFVCGGCGSKAALHGFLRSTTPPDLVHVKLDDGRTVPILVSEGASEPSGAA